MASASLLRFPRTSSGAATAAYQIEGAVHEDGRKPRLGYFFPHPRQNFSGEPATSPIIPTTSTKRTCNCSRTWAPPATAFPFRGPVSFPTETGQPNEKGIAYYQRVVDELLKNNIAPYITLFHWDLPQALPGGWQSRDTAKAFADYADTFPASSPIASLIFHHQRVRLLHRPRLQKRQVRARPEIA